MRYLEVTYKRYKYQPVFFYRSLKVVYRFLSTTKKARSKRNMTSLIIKRDKGKKCLSFHNLFFCPISLFNMLNLLPLQLKSYQMSEQITSVEWIEISLALLSIEIISRGSVTCLMKLRGRSRRGDNFVIVCF